MKKNVFLFQLLVAVSAMVVYPHPGRAAKLSDKANNYFLDDSVSGFALYPGSGYRSYVDPQFMIASLIDLEARLSKLPSGAQLYWNPYRKDPSGKPLLFKEGQFDEFQKFCVRHGIDLNVINETPSQSQANLQDGTCPAGMKPTEVPGLNREIALTWEAKGWTVFKEPQLRADFNGDGKKDLALLCRTDTGIQFIVLWSGKFYVDLNQLISQKKAKGQEIMKTYCDSHIRTEGVTCDSGIKLGKGKGIDMGGGEDYHCLGGNLRVWTNLNEGGD